MAYRITNRDIERVVARINEVLGVPNECYLTDEQGEVVRGENGLIANEGTVYLASAYGGVRLEQMSRGGGSRDLLSSGYDTKRAVYREAQAFLRGLEMASKE